MKSYVVAAIRPWNIDAFARHSAAWPGRWTLITEKEALTPERIAALKPRYVFFPHWSWRVPEAVLNAAECVCFHMTDVPYGRGGSPLQNLIAGGHTDTVVSALRMEPELDSGPVYMKRPLSLEGRAQEVYERAAEVIFHMIAEIAQSEPAPVPQLGEPVFFPRRIPAQSEIPASASPDQLYDHIRMLDAEGYPHAFVEHGAFRLEFTGAARGPGDEITARVTIKPRARPLDRDNGEGTK